MADQVPADYEAIPQAVEIHPEDPVKYVFEDPAKAGSPDTASKALMEGYLAERFIPEDDTKTRVVLTETGKTLPGVIRVPDGTKQVKRVEKTEGYWVGRKVAAAVTVGSLALFNAVPMAQTTSFVAQSAAHKIYRVFNPVEDNTVLVPKVTSTPGRVVNISVDAQTISKVGSSEADPAAIAEFESQIDEVIAGEPEAEVSLDFEGKSSDEWGDDESIGQRDQENIDLADLRASEARDEVLESLQGVNVTAEVTAEEAQVAPEIKLILLEKVRQEGFANIREAIRAVDNGESVDPELAAEINKHFISKRGTKLSAEVMIPGEEEVSVKLVTKTIPGEDNPPTHKPFKWRPWLIPLPPIRRRRVVEETREKNRWQFVPSRPILKPEIIKEDKEHAWVRLRPEALKKDGTLVPNPWAYTRKYEDLLKDGRIYDILRADFSNSQGESKALRIMFVDHNPADKTIAAFENALTKFAAMQDGKLADRISGIFVFPSKNAGLNPADPRRIGIGVDKQSDRNILGTCTPILELVEMHMSDTWDPEQLVEMFEDFDGPLWTLTHEVAGHGTDLADQPPYLEAVKARGIKNAHIIRGQTWAQRMSPLDSVLKKLPWSRSERASDPVEFDITYKVVDVSGNVRTLDARVDSEDPRIHHALTATVVGRRPTQYGGTNDLEHYAETAAPVTSGMEAPFRQAKLDTQLTTGDDGKVLDFTRTYRPDVRGQNLFTKAVGGIEGSYPIEFANPPKVGFTYTKPENDRLLQAEIARVRTTKSLSPNKMVAVLSRTVRRGRKAQ